MPPFRLLPFLLLLSLPLRGQEAKGLGEVFRDRQGQEVGSYTRSYALLIGVSDYRGGWPDLESVPG